MEYRVFVPIPPITEKCTTCFLLALFLVALPFCTYLFGQTVYLATFISKSYSFPLNRLLLMRNPDLSWSVCGRGVIDLWYSPTSAYLKDFRPLRPWVPVGAE